MSRSGARVGDHLLDLGVALGVQHGEGQVLQLPLHLLDAEAVGQRRVDVERLLGGALLLPLGHGRDRAHVVEPVGQLDEQDPESLAIATSILRIVAACCASLESKRSRSSLVTPSTMAATSAPKSRGDVVEGDAGVLDRVVQQGGGEGDVVEAELGQDRGHRERVADVGLARLAHLVARGRRSATS